MTSHKHQGMYEMNTASEAHSATSRWTSSAYAVQFATVRQFEPFSHGQSFDLSAWGISHLLRNLLLDVPDSQIRSATDWLTSHQNDLIADLLHRIAHESQLTGSKVPPLHEMFITVEDTLVLPQGIQMPVACVTNIVPHGNEEDSMDKFVAVLDAVEIETYINERTGRHLPSMNKQVH